MSKEARDAIGVHIQPPARNVEPLLREPDRGRPPDQAVREVAANRLWMRHT